MGRLLVITLLLALVGQGGVAQTDEPPLVVPFAPIPPFMYRAPDGARTGFMVELSEMIGAEIGVEIDYLDLDDAPAVVAAQASGQSQMIAGLVQLPFLTQTNLYAAEVAREELRIAVLESRRTELANGPMAGLRIAVLEPVVGPVEPLLSRNIRMDFEAPPGALMALLTDQVDAVMLPPTVVYYLARQAGLDGRIAFVGEPLWTNERRVVVHQSRSHLLEPINAVLARLEEDGRLEELRQRYKISVPPPPPDVLTVGVIDFGIYSKVNDDGTFSGFSVEALGQLADRAGLELEFVEISNEEWSMGPGVGPYDILPQISINAERAARMDFTQPVESASYGIFMRRGETEGVTGLDDLQDLRVRAIRVSQSNQHAQEAGLPEIRPFETLKEMSDALRREEIDAVINLIEPFEALLKAEGATDEIEQVEPPYIVV